MTELGDRRALSAAGAVPVSVQPPVAVGEPDAARIVRVEAKRRFLHAGAWWLWAGGMAAAAMRTTNPLLLGLALAVVAFVVAARRPMAPWARSFGTFLRLGLFVIAVRLMIQILFGTRFGDTTLFTLPAIELPAWAAGVTIGGPVTLEAMAQAFVQGLRLAVVLACFGAVNALCSPYRMLRSLPPVLYEAGVAVTVALSFAPQAVAAISALRAARRLRGRPVRGIRALPGLAVPVLEDALDRSIALAASMDSRGYGYRPPGAPGSPRTSAVLLLTGMLGVCIGVYGILDAGAPRLLGLPLLAGGALALTTALLVTSRRSSRTRYRPDPWRLPEWAVAASGATAAAGLALVAVHDPTAVGFETIPLQWPAFPLVAVAALLTGVAPAFCAPRPPTLPSTLEMSS